MSPIIIILSLITLVLGAGIALGAGYLYGRTQNKERYEASLRIQKEASEQRLLEVQAQQNAALKEAREETAHFRSTIERENAERRTELQRQERRLQQKEENLDRKIEMLEQRERKLATKERTLEQMREELEELHQKQFRELERISQL
ncbi:MAG: DUF3552 domain-containing protein, partial [Chloroflexi bacterium]|nr:DUF3552 domain-containing protein [Chloroflexota bacterium]